ncbi:hypothetical protein IFM89_009614 [Coptis chinensis]|uniref:Uncharacterized protein n=1 Tax=Coptis chinensis TaxID=261450 RepID=A0A835IUH4_9MAGN|nr:hypothetical protein IFM89_009614 [Coptis chinensis]
MVLRHSPLSRLTALFLFMKRCAYYLSPRVLHSECREGWYESVPYKYVVCGGTPKLDEAMNIKVDSPRTSTLVVSSLDNKRAMEEVFGGNVENFCHYDVCLNVMASRIAAVCASIRISVEYGREFICCFVHQVCSFVAEMLGTSED